MKLTLLVILALVATSCIPVYEHYYQPQSGDVRRSVCRGSVGPSDSATFSPEKNVKIKIRSDKGRYAGGDAGIVYICLEIPKGHYMTLDSEEFTVTEASEGKVHKAEFVDIQPLKHPLTPPKPFDPKEKIEGNTSLINWAIFGEDLRESHMVYTLRAYFKGRLPESFVLLMPGVKLDDKYIDLPVIEFRKKSGFFIYPLNC